VLLVNLIMDGPPALSLGVDPVSPDDLHHPPPRRGERPPFSCSRPGHSAAVEANTAGTPTFHVVVEQIFNLPDGLPDRPETASIAPAWATALRTARR
jgi:magnesium-transporting ATPase (P-type)